MGKVSMENAKAKLYDHHVLLASMVMDMVNTGVHVEFSATLMGSRMRFLWRYAALVRRRHIRDQAIVPIRTSRSAATALSSLTLPTC